MSRKAIAAMDAQTEEMRASIDDLCAAVEPLCGFKPESRAQAISLLTTRLLELVPALEALRALAVKMDFDDRGIDPL